ncbi:MAG: hypothetical protein UIC65_01055 [Alphaproteobacteria bacterium]|nr:hypothetical protein [Alphaproteobacteria bacterium]
MVAQSHGKLSIKEVVVADKLAEEAITKNTISFIAPVVDYIPQINYKDITEFTDINNIHHSKTACSSYEKACKLLREKILPACDNYNKQR